MSIPFLQHSIQPENSASSYQEFQTLDFVATCEGRRFLANSFRISGKVRVLPDKSVPGTPIDPTADQILIDGKIGAHGFIEAIQTSMQGAGGVVENLTGYARYCGSVADATQSENDLFNAEQVCEMKAPFNAMVNDNLEGFTTPLTGSTINEPNSFSIKPLFVLNATSSADGSGDLSMSYNKVGAIRVQVTLARDFACIFGDDVANASGYILEDVRLEFMSVPESGAMNKTAHRVKYHIRQSILSGSTNVSAKIPAVCDAVSCSFIKASDENIATANNYQRQTLPNVTQLQFLFNNNTNELVQYVINDRTEILMRYLQSFKDQKHNSMTLKNLKGNKSYGIGLDFGEFVDLTNQTFNLQVTSGVSSASPFSAHLYFHSLVEV